MISYGPRRVPGVSDTQDRVIIRRRLGVGTLDSIWCPFAAGTTTAAKGGRLFRSLYRERAHFLRDPGIPSLRLGKQWRIHRRREKILQPVIRMLRRIRELLKEPYAEHERLKKAGTIEPWVFFRMVAKRRRGKKEPTPITTFTSPRSTPVWRRAAAARGASRTTCDGPRCGTWCAPVSQSAWR